MNTRHHFLTFLRAITSVVCCSAMLCSAQSGQSWLNLLRQRDFNELEVQTLGFQKRFSDGQETEFSMRQAYRPFYSITQDDLQKLNEWQDAYPKSYSAHLILGAYYKRAGLQARGTESAKRTPADNFKKMDEFMKVARQQLSESLALTDKPYLSAFHLLEISQQNCNRPELKALMDAGTKLLPSNRLIRSRYMRALEPRWCGSYEDMKEFLAYARKTGASAIGLKELEAIIFDDEGDSAVQSGDRVGAVRNFKRALELGDQVGGEVPKELVYSFYFKCQLPELKAYCR